MLLDLVGDRGPVADRARAPCAAARGAAPGRRPGARAGPASVIASPGGNSRPSSPSPGQLAVDGELRGDRNRAGRERLRGSGRAPVAGRPRRRTSTSAPAISASAAHLARADHVRRARAARWRDADLVGLRGSRRRPPSRVGRVEAAERAQEQPQRAPLLVEAERDPQPGGRFRRLGRSATTARPPRRRPARSARSGRGRSARSARRSRCSWSCPRVEPAEEDLDQRPGDLGREDALGGLVEAADVERAGVAQGGRGEAGRERVVDVDDVEVDPAEQVLERAARRRAAAAPRAGAGRAAAGSRLPTASTGGLVAPRHTRTRETASGGRIGDRRARVADRAARVRRRRDHHPVAAVARARRRPRATNSLTSCRVPQGCGVTWAIERRSARRHAARIRPPLAPRP